MFLVANLANPRGHICVSHYHSGGLQLNYYVIYGYIRLKELCRLSGAVPQQFFQEGNWRQWVTSIRNDLAAQAQCSGSADLMCCRRAARKRSGGGGT